MNYKQAVDYIQTKGGSRAIPSSIATVMANNTCKEIATAARYKWRRREKALTITPGVMEYYAPYDTAIIEKITRASGVPVPRLDEEEYWEWKQGSLAVDVMKYACFTTTGDPYYTTGTIAHSGTAITGTGTAFTSAMVGMAVRVAGEQRLWKIATVTDGTHATTTESRAVAVTGQAFEINPAPIKIIKVINPPDTAEDLTLLYTVTIPYITDNYQHFIIPPDYDWVMILGFEVKQLSYDNRYDVEYYKKYDSFQRAIGKMIADDVGDKASGKLASMKRLQDVGNL